MDRRSGSTPRHYWRDPTGRWHDHDSAFRTDNFQDEDMVWAMSRETPVPNVCPLPVLSLMEVLSRYKKHPTPDRSHPSFFAVTSAYKQSPLLSSTGRTREYMHPGLQEQTVSHAQHSVISFPRPSFLRSCQDIGGHGGVPPAYLGAEVQGSCRQPRPPATVISGLDGWRSESAANLILVQN